MRIAEASIFTADAGYRTAKYLRITTDDGIEGWSEYYDQFNGAPIAPSITSLIAVLQEHGFDPSMPGVISDTLHATTKVASGGNLHQAIAAIENACLDVQGKALGLPVSKLLGGPFRTRIPIYWTHYGSFRAAFAGFFKRAHGFEPLESMEDLSRLASEVRSHGIRAVKTNPLCQVDGRLSMYGNGLKLGPGLFDSHLSLQLIRDVHAQLDVLQDSLGPDVEIMLDVNFMLRADGYRRLARELDGRGLRWLELDGPEPGALQEIKRSATMPIASLESLYGAQAYRPYLEARSVDVPLIDVLWNGAVQSSKIAHLSEAYGLNVGLHNPVGHLGTLMSAHFAAAFSNVAVLEVRMDEAPWIDTFLTQPPVITDGHLILSDEPGWGTAIDVDQLAEYPRTNRELHHDLPH
ncbi:mandelate racemase/muconate lactonizing enzyme family protein [Paenarthrobacter sp. NPDC056912]|uniref:mandelate racemase/muconate lactonizing enzyme family protein n=1 Tax=Paenarthrobacter sp. NPDC056912 TaxID=3345965 RepID=UPI00366EF16F